MKRIQQALKTMEPLVNDQELPLSYQSRLRHICRGLEILGEEIGRWQEGNKAAKKELAAAPQPAKPAVQGEMNLEGSELESPVRESDGAEGA